MTTKVALLGVDSGPWEAELVELTQTGYTIRVGIMVWTHGLGSAVRTNHPQSTVKVSPREAQDPQPVLIEGASFVRYVEGHE